MNNNLFMLMILYHDMINFIIIVFLLYFYLFRCLFRFLLIVDRLYGRVSGIDKYMWL